MGISNLNCSKLLYLVWIGFWDAFSIAVAANKVFTVLVKQKERGQPDFLLMLISRFLLPVSAWFSMYGWTSTLFHRTAFPEINWIILDDCNGRTFLPPSSFCPSANQSATADLFKNMAKGRAYLQIIWFCWDATVWNWQVCDCFCVFLYVYVCVLCVCHHLLKGDQLRLDSKRSKKGDGRGHSHKAWRRTCQNILHLMQADVKLRFFLVYRIRGLSSFRLPRLKSHVGTSVGMYIRLALCSASVSVALLLAYG